MSKVLLVVVVLIAVFLVVNYWVAMVKGSSPHKQFTTTPMNDTILRDSRPKNYDSNMPPVKPSQHENANVSKTLPAQVIDGVKKFVFFVGYSRSGHSIVSTLMDAHPHVVISNEYLLFGRNLAVIKGQESVQKRSLFEKIYQHSVKDATHNRANFNKGYSLGVSGLWQGKYDKYIEVIGDKSGHFTTENYAKNKNGFKTKFESLKKMVSVPIRVIHVMRNPYDLISTKVCLSDAERFCRLIGRCNSTASTDEKFNDPQKLEKITSFVFQQFKTVVEMTADVLGKENVLDVHSCDLVHDPRATMSRIFEFLEVNTSEQYLDACAEKVFKTVYRSRIAVVWTPEHIKNVQERMQNFQMLNRYNFTTD